MRARFLVGIVCTVLGVGSVSAQLIPSGPGFRLNAPGSGRHTAPSISAGFQGRKVVVWVHQDGLPAADAVLLRRDNSGSAIWASGALSVSWMEGDPIRLNFQRFTPAGVPQGTPQQVATLAAPLHRIEMAANTAGETMIVWSAQAGARWTVQGRIYRANGTPKTNAFRIDTDSSSSLALTDPAVASDGRNFAVAWDNHGDPGSVFVWFVDANGALPGAPVQVDPFNRSVQVAPAVAGGPAGNFTVVWEDHGGDGGSDVVGQHFIVPATP